MSVSAIQSGRWRVGFEASGAGEPVILVHSSVSGRQQWRSLTGELASRFQVVAVDLFGYGESSSWPPRRPQTLTDQTELVLGLLQHLGRRPLALVGHSFGGAVAMKAALRLGTDLAGLVLLDPNPFYLLAMYGRAVAGHARVPPRRVPGGAATQRSRVGWGHERHDATGGMARDPRTDAAAAGGAHAPSHPRAQ